MSLLSKYTLNIKSVLTEKVIDVIADIILQYTGSFVNLSKIESIPDWGYYYFLTANVLSARIYSLTDDYRVYFSIKNNVGEDEKKENVRECSQMFANVRKCSQMFANVRKCSQMFANVRKCSQMFANVRKCSQMFANVLYLMEIY
jgi:hypothetical protein